VEVNAQCTERSTTVLDDDIWRGDSLHYKLTYRGYCFISMSEAERRGHKISYYLACLSLTNGKSGRKADFKIIIARLHEFKVPIKGVNGENGQQNQQQQEEEQHHHHYHQQQQH
jgi:hypothetical protein